MEGSFGSANVWLARVCSLLVRGKEQVKDPDFCQQKFPDLSGVPSSRTDSVLQMCIRASSSDPLCVELRECDQHESGKVRAAGHQHLVFLLPRYRAFHFVGHPQAVQVVQVQNSQFA
jgi:hypothetical protein